MVTGKAIPNMFLAALELNISADIRTRCPATVLKCLLITIKVLSFDVK